MRNCPESYEHLKCPKCDSVFRYPHNGSYMTAKDNLKHHLIRVHRMSEVEARALLIELGYIVKGQTIAEAIKEWEEEWECHGGKCTIGGK